MKRLNYGQRLFIWLVGYSLLMTGCFVAFQYNREKEFKINELNSQLQLINTYILSELAEGHDVAHVDLHEFHPFEDVRISVVNEQGKVLYDNALDTIRSGNHRDRQEIKDALSTGSGYAVRRHSVSTGDHYFYSATRGADGYIVRTAVPYSVSLSMLLEADHGFLRVMAVIMLVMCVFGYFSTRRLGDNIRRLDRFAAKIERGARITDSEPFPHDELGDISNHIVRLYARLQQANADRDAEHKAALHQQREKERIKKQLTNNINHELKTPVASIRLCIETLLAHPGLSEEQRRDFLQRSLSNTERLQHLLDDVALITRMDDGGRAIVREQVDLHDIIAEVVADHQQLAEAKGFVIDNRVNIPLTMQGNHSLLTSIFNNLIDNALSYSGGNRVTIALQSVTDRSIALTVSDNGTGVPAEHLDHIFERFYRIDKGRSRAAGGTGLGLSIVRNAVVMHGGNITAGNLPGGGLQMRMTLLRK